jgi:hypothetical protein
MRSKTISQVVSQVNTKGKRDITNASKNPIQHLDDILNEEVVTRTTRRQPIRSPSSSNTRNTRNGATNTDKTPNHGQTTNQSQEVTDVPEAKSEVWEYATKLQSGKAKCHNCNREISCKDHSTTGLRRHLHRCVNSSKFPRSGGGTSNKSISNDMKKKLNELVYQCIIEDGRTFGDLRKSGMTRFLNEILPGE